MHREHVTSSPIACRMSPVSTGSSPPSCAAPSTNGSRRKLVTSSRARVRAALNDATDSTKKSSGVWHAGLRPSMRAAPPATPRPPTKTPRIAAYASYGGLLTVAIEATLGRNARVQNIRRLPADGGPADRDRDARRGFARRRSLPDAGRRDRHRQDRDDGLDDRGGWEAGTRDRAQQDARRAALQRVPRVLPVQRGRVLRLVLRLLPARGLRAAGGSVHREGLVAERRHRAAAARGDLCALHPARRRRRRLGVVHLRPRLARGVARPRGPSRGGG